MLSRLSATSRLSKNLLRNHFSTTEAPLSKTALYDMTVSIGGKMVPFAGYEMAVQFNGAGVLKEHLHCRAENSSSLFDVGHMGQLYWRGKDRARFLETVVVADVAALAPGASVLTLVTLPSGGILDDSIISNHGDSHYMVVNGATKHGDIKHFDEQLAAFKKANPGADVSYEHLSHLNLVAIQGPGAAAALSTLLDGGASVKDAVAKMSFMSGKKGISVAGIKDCIVTRCGYTGEDGYEVSVTPQHAEKLARALLAAPGVMPAGLGARDSLRLEAGLCLYGHDMDDKITPNEATLAWVIPKSRRDLSLPKANFLGAKKILTELKDKSMQKRRVGLRITGAPAREGAKIFKRAPAGSDSASAPGGPIGVITSGTFSPCLKAPVAMGYVPASHFADGTQLSVESRGKLVDAVVSKMPFVPSRYFRG